ncbi:hypothetical protein BOX15_Mlig013662g3, partial [Macrostomum lignano]
FQALFRCKEMLTPKFSVSQDSSHVIVDIWLTGLCRLDKAEASVQDDTLLFSCEPYFLRLQLTGSCLDSDDATAGSSGLTASEFDVDAGGVLTLRIRKLVIGEQFPDLDMLNRLMAPAGASASSCGETAQSERRLLVEELLSGEEPPSECLAAAGADLDWFVEPHLDDEAADCRLATSADAISGGGLGFAFRRRDEQSASMLRGLDHLLPDLASMSHSERLAAKEALEDAQFDADYYLADQLDPSDMLTDILSRPDCLPPLLDSEERRARLMALPRRPLLPPEAGWEMRVCLMALADLVFAFCLDWRVCEGEQTPESARTILTQAACLSCQCPLTSVPQLLRSCYRRLLAYSLLRNWQLCQLVAMDTAGVLSNKRLTLDCLIRLERLLSSVEGYAGVNYLTVTDTCRWVQHCPSDLLNSLSEAIRNAANCFKKEEVGLGLIEWENEATSCGQDLAD